jgi:hypothetical protein
MFRNSALKKELEESRVMVDQLVDRCANLEILKASLIEFLSEKRAKNIDNLRREKAKARPLEKKVYALEEIGHELAEIQNRIMDLCWD